MRYRILAPAFVLAASLAIAGAGCANSPAKTTTTRPSAPQAAAPIVPATPVVPAEKLCTEAGVVTYTNTDDTNATWSVSLDGKVVGTLSRDGESAVYPWLETPGTTYLAFDPSGMGGYIPYSGHSTLVSVNHCTGVLSKFVSPQNGLDLMALSPDASRLVTMATFEGMTSSATHVYLWDTKTALSGMGAATPMNDWTLPDAWTYVGSFAFNADGTMLAFAAADGPENEHGAVYTLDLKTGTFAKVQEKADGLLNVDGFEKDGTLKTH